MSSDPLEIKDDCPLTIASKAEWAEAKRQLIQDKKTKGSLASGHKCNYKSNKSLKHSFLFLSSPDGREKLLAVSKHYYLGVGVFGRVKVVEDETGKRFALKILRKGLHDNEKNVLSKLGCLLFTGKGCHNTQASKTQNLNKANTSYVLMELVDGINLEDYLSIYASSLTKEQKMSLAFQMALAIERLHAANIVHGDLKPSNFILQTNGQLKIVDFGASHWITEQNPTFTGKLAGAPFYRTAENKYTEGKKIKPQGTLSKRTDRYAFGKILKHDLKLGSHYGLCNEHDNLATSAMVEDFRPDSQVVIPQDRLQERLRAKHFKALEKTRKYLNAAYAQSLAKDLRKKNKHLVIDPLPSDWEEKMSSSSDDDESTNLEDKSACKFSIVSNKDIGSKSWKYGELCIYGKGKQGIIVDPQKYLKHVRQKNKDLSLLELVSLSQKNLKAIKGQRLQSIKELVKFTNNIEELLLFFNQLKLEETNQPFLRKERCFLMGKAGMTDSWKEALLVFKVRAMELVKNELNLQHALASPEKYRVIFQEGRSRFFLTKPDHLKEFERIRAII